MAESQAGVMPGAAEPAIAGRPLRVGVLHNPLSGGNRRQPGALRRELDAYREVPRHDVQTPADVAAALADFARRGVEVVAIDGGDGTVQAVLTAVFGARLFDTPPRLAVLAAGTTSMIAGDVGLRGPRPAALQRLLAWTRVPDARGHVVERTVLRLDRASGAPPLFGMFFGTAAIEQGIRFCRARVHTLGVRGEIGAGLALGALLVGLARRRAGVTAVPVTTALDGARPERRDHLVVMVTTLERLVLGLRPFWGDGAGPLHYTAVLGRPRRLAAALPRVLRGRPGGAATADNGYVSRDVAEVRLWLDGVGYTLDGELFTGQAADGPVVLRAGGRARFVRC